MCFVQSRNCAHEPISPWPPQDVGLLSPPGSNAARGSARRGMDVVKSSSNVLIEPGIAPSAGMSDQVSAVCRSG